MNLKEFSDSLKKVFGSLLPLKTADSNYAVGLFNKADGTPAGMMDMPALASVLGVGFTQYRGSGTVNGMPNDYGTHFKFVPKKGEDVSSVIYGLEVFKAAAGAYGTVYIKTGTNDTWKAVVFES